MARPDFDPTAEDGPVDDSGLMVPCDKRCQWADEPGHLANCAIEWR